MTSKNSRVGKGRDFMGHHEGDMLNTLPKHNYATGKGWKSTDKYKTKGAFGIYTVIRKIGGNRKERRML